MINEKLLFPYSIVVVGGSNDIRKPGGRVLKNLIDGKFHGDIYVVNPKETDIQGQKTYCSVHELPFVDLAIIAIASKFAVETVEILTKNKKTKAFIILSAGFSEEGAEGKNLESKIVEIIESVGGSLLGPNCIGALTPEYHGVFTSPIPKLNLKGCDFISGSGATACFIMEAGIPKGLPFARIFSVGNSAQLGIEEILEYMDETFDPAKSPRVKLLYIENISRPAMLLKHARSLINKGCKIAAIKAGTSEAGKRAASSHTGALASSDAAADALFRKAGIVRCYGRDELIYVASVFHHKEMKGSNIAIITHAGGPAVMLTDALSDGGMNVPHINSPAANELLATLNPGSSVANPIDFLATGTAEQLGNIIDCVDKRFDNIDAMVIIFGTTGLTRVYDAYDMIHLKMKTAGKPIYPVLPSVNSASDEIRHFLDKGRIYFQDEVLLGYALAKVFHNPLPAAVDFQRPVTDHSKIRSIIDSAGNGYLAPDAVRDLLDAAGIPRSGEAVVSSVEDAVSIARKLCYPLVMKVVGPVHKSDVGGVALNVKNEATVVSEFNRMIMIPETTAILMQPMLSGTELFIGAKREEKFGHLVMCGLGGIFIEILKDVVAGLAPLSLNEAHDMMTRLKGYKVFKGARGQEPINEELFAEIITRVSALVEAAPEIYEMDINPLLGKQDKVVAVDARIRIEK
ncbi:MAG: acetate--CoA ligase family protein [Bacteroidia bacterium]|nr:acetate--CoA ligase family protein [Bacteroidia bacterium]